jgi:hypothetical protein
MVERARIVLLAADGKLDKEIAVALNITAHKAAGGGTGLWIWVWRDWRRTLRAAGARRAFRPGIPPLAASGRGRTSSQ